MILVTPKFCIAYTITKTNYPGEPVYIYINSLINIIQDKNWVISTKKCKVNYHYFVIVENRQFPSMGMVH